MNIMMFCSNPVNGGTAKVFFELVTSFKDAKREQDNVFAGVNKNNPVEIYKQIDILDRLNVFSEEEVCSNLYGGNILFRIVKRIVRKIIYYPVKKKNIKQMMQYLIKNNIQCVCIHNGGYIGDDLCNQMLEASYKCRKITHGRMFVMHSDLKKNLLTRFRFYGYDKKISKEATELITVSNFTKERILQSSFIRKNIEVIYNGLPEKNFLSREQKKSVIDVNENVKNVLMLGNFSDNKGQLKFVEAARIVKEAIGTIHFTFIGNIYDNDYFKLCEKKIKDYKLEDYVSFYHGINNASEYIELFDVVVVPSMYDESFGLISVEAMSQGVPVVAFACGGIPEVLLDKCDGYVVPVGDSDMMAARIIELMVDEQKCKIMGKNGKIDYLNRFTVDVMCKNYYSVIERYRK